MKILIVHNGYRNRGGEDSVVRAETELLKSAGNTVVEHFRSNQEIHADSLVQKTRLGANTIWSLSSYRAIKELIARERPDIAHMHNTFPLISPSAYATHHVPRICPAAHRSDRSQLQNALRRRKSVS